VTELTIETGQASETERPLRADARRNRECILQAAREVFAKSGIDAQMDDVASRAGVGVGTVYRHFPTKEALMAELVRQKFRVFAAAARESHRRRVAVPLATSPPTGSQTVSATVEQVPVETTTTHNTLTFPVTFH